MPFSRLVRLSPTILVNENPFSAIVKRYASFRLQADGTERGDEMSAASWIVVGASTYVAFERCAECPWIASPQSRAGTVGDSPIISSGFGGRCPRGGVVC